MNTAPAASTVNVNLVPAAVPAPSQTSAQGAASKFLDLFLNLGSTKNQGQEDGQPANSKTVLLKKKISPEEAVASLLGISTRPTLPLPAAPQSLPLSLTLPPGSVPTKPQTSVAALSNVAEPTQELIAGPIALVQSVSGKVLADESVPLAEGTNTSNQPALALSTNRPASTPETMAARAAVAPKSIVPEASPGSRILTAPVPMVVAAPPPRVDAISAFNEALPASSPSASPKTSQEPETSTPRSSLQSSPAQASTDLNRPVALSTDNLAFSVQLEPLTGKTEPVADAATTTIAATAKPELIPQSSTNTNTTAVVGTEPLPETAQRPTITSEARIQAVLPTEPAVTPSSPKIVSAPSGGRAPAYSDTPSQQPQTFGKSTSHDSGDSAKHETDPREEFPADSRSAGPAPIANPQTTASHQVLTDGALAGSAPMLGAGTHIDSGPSLSVSDRPAPTSPVVAGVHEIQQVNVSSPRTSPNHEILLNLGNGQNAAAVRVVDKAGTVTVSVHSNDQELRSSLRSNLAELTTQLNAQGVKTEVLKTASAQSPADSRQEQSSPDRRSFSQQQTLSQNDRQSQRERRNNSAWLDELAEQASSANPGR